MRQGTERHGLPRLRPFLLVSSEGCFEGLWRKEVPLSKGLGGTIAVDCRVSPCFRKREVESGVCSGLPTKDKSGASDSG
jgi:hypothetical protein